MNKSLLALITSKKTDVVNKMKQNTHGKSADLFGTSAVAVVSSKSSL